MYLNVAVSSALHANACQAAHDCGQMIVSCVGRWLNKNLLSKSFVLIRWNANKLYEKLYTD